MAATTNANTDVANAEGAAGAAARRTVSNVETSDVKVDIGEAEAQARGLAENSDFASQAAKRMMEESLDGVNNLRKISEQMLANLVVQSNQQMVNLIDVANKQQLRFIRNIAEDAIAADIVESGEDG